MAAIIRNNTGFDDASSQFGGSASCRNSSTDICPYCRSYRGEFKERSVDANFSTCVQPSSTCSNISVAAYHNCGTDRRELSSLNAHPFHCYPLVRISSSANSTTNSQSPQQNGIWLRSSVHNFNHICRCTKSISSSRASNLQGATFNSPIDGWRAARLVLLGILIILPVSTMSSPVHGRQSRSPSPHSSGSGHHSHRSSPHRSDKPMKWVNPCRIPKSLPSQESELQMPTQTDEEIFQNIVTQAKKAEIQARQFFSAFKEECFGQTGHDISALHYDWLKDVAEKVGKDLGEPIGQSRLETFEVEDILKSMYRGLQKLAVGLEQVVLDQAFHGGSFYQHFHEAEFQLKYVLCEFQIAMMEKNIQYEDVTRDIMDKHFVNLEEKTWRDLRDFSIFRDYLNTLEFIKESFEHFWKQAKETS